MTFCVCGHSRAAHLAPDADCRSCPPDRPCDGYEPVEVTPECTCEGGENVAALLHYRDCPWYAYEGNDRCVFTDCSYSAEADSSYCALHGVRWGRGERQ